MANRRGKKPFVGGGKASRFQTPPNTSRGRDMPSLNPRWDRPSGGPATPVHGFSMRDEVRNTLSHQSGWTPNARLRERPVAFVSAGFVEPLKDIKASEPSPEDTDQSSDKGGEAALDGGLPAPVPDGADDGKSQVLEVVETTVAVEEEVVIPNAPATAELKSGHDNGVQGQRNGATSSPTFFFDLTGDKNMRAPQHAPPEIPSPRAGSDASDSSEEVILFRGRSANPQNRVSLGCRGKQPEVVGKTKPEIRAVATKVLQHKGKRNQRSRSRHLKPSPLRHQSPAPPEESIKDEEDAILADYIANMAADDEGDFLSQLTSFGRRELGDPDGAFGEEDEEDQTSGSGSGASNADDDDELDKGLDSAEGAEGSGDHGMDLDMDDEDLARLFAKQEQLGISSDELLLFSDAYKSRRGTGSTAAARRAKIANNSLSVTEAMDELDLSGWEQAIPGKRKGRRRKQAPAFNVSDSELEAALKKAWERDRERKKDRKMEREALRAQGLLGKNVNPDDLRVKYQSGMKLDEIKYELLTFLFADMETIQFPPMDKQARKILHELANKFKIKSQSTGNNDQRRPVLYRTKRTVRYSETQYEAAERHVDEAASWIKRKYFHRVDVKGQGRIQGRETSGPSSGRSGYKAVTYKDGEIAGASIPELGQENKGRAMLEKMGWAKGMGLGSVENKGILEPVVQVVKRSKAGLG